ncbi:MULTISPECIES: hypothetical protein [unclassified Roseobacter]|nr:MULTISPECIES: hypothetical protein [unclassified Roseobacter]
MRQLGKILATTALAAAAVAAQAEEGSFDGYTLRVKFIGGAQYEPLYTLIPQWEEATGATVDIISRKSHFELDREMKQDIASGTIDYCVFSNHTSFAPQYKSMTASLNDHISQDILADFVPLVIEHATVEGELLQMPRHSDISNLYYVKSLYEDALASQLTRSTDSKTLPVGLMDFTSQFTIDWAGMCAMAVIIIIPALILTFLVQKHLIAGLTFGGVKG